MDRLFYLNFVRFPNTKFDDLSVNNVKSVGRNFYLQGEQGRIGVWHILPSTLAEEQRSSGSELSEAEYEKMLTDTKYPIIFYVHGVSFTRANGHRCELYNLLTDQDYHVIAFDYRGYGDSDGKPTEVGMIYDTRLVYDYVKENKGDNSLFVWGHSMGSSISTSFVRLLSLEQAAPNGLILEAPFNNLTDVVYNQAFLLPFRWFNFSVFQTLVLNPMNNAGLFMETDKKIGDVDCPILIIHAEDDHIVPVDLGRLLVEKARLHNRNVEYLELESKKGYRHEYICRYEKLPSVIRNFLEKCRTSPVEEEENEEKEDTSIAQD